MMHPFLLYLPIIYIHMCAGGDHPNAGAVAAQIIFAVIKKDHVQSGSH